MTYKATDLAAYMTTETPTDLANDLAAYMATEAVTDLANDFASELGSIRRLDELLN